MNRGEYPGDSERPERSMVTHYEIEQSYLDDAWHQFDSASTLEAARDQISLYDDYAAERPTRIVRVSVTTERQVVG